jgi:hypothetical protein
MIFLVSMFYFVAAWIVHDTGGAYATTVIRMPRGTISFPIEYIPAEGTETFSGFGTLDFHGTSFRFDSRNYDPRINRGLTSREARGILIGEPPIRIDFDREHTVRNSPSATENDFRIVLPGGRGSAMSRDVQSFLFTPVSETEDILVLNPTNASQYAFEGQIFYTNMLGEARDTPWPIRAAVRLSSGSSSVPTPEDYMPLGLTMTDVDTLYLPRHLRRDIIRSLDALDMGYHGGSLDWIEFHVSDTTLLAALPSIEVLIATETGEIVHIARIDPFDYINYTYNLVRFRIQFGPVSSFAITPRIFQNLVIHFDTQNGRVGFADPLVELL